MNDLSGELEKVLKKYPLLQKSTFDGKLALTGSFMAHNPISGIEIEPYNLTIIFPNEYPFKVLPTVWETGGKITRHLLENKSLCFGNWQDTIALCMKGLSLQKFFETVLNPHLCREFVRDKTGEYPTGERSHGMEGIWEGYYEIFKTNNKVAILHDLEMIFNYSESIKRNDACFCESGKKFKRCHQPFMQQVLLPGRKEARLIFTLLKRATEHYEKD